MLLVLLPWSFADLQMGLRSSSCADDLLHLNDSGLRVAFSVCG